MPIYPTNALLQNNASRRSLSSRVSKPARFSGGLSINQQAQHAIIMSLTLMMSGVKTWMHAKAYKHTPGFTEEQRRLLTVQEGVRQVISSMIWVGSYVVFHLFLGKLLPKQDDLGRSLCSMLLSSIPDTFFRPFATAAISKRILDYMHPTKSTAIMAQKELAPIKPISEKLFQTPHSQGIPAQKIFPPYQGFAGNQQPYWPYACTNGQLLLPYPATMR